MKSRAARIAATFLACLAGPADAVWVASWTAPPHAPLGASGPFAAATYDDVTLAQTLRVTQGGRRLRIGFSNRYGPRPLAIGAARVVRLDRADQEVPGSSRALTFGGETAATIPHGAPFSSDVVALDVPDLSRLNVVFYLRKRSARAPAT